MAFFDNLTRKAQDVASVAGEKAKMAADTAKINMQIASEQREIEKDYKTIGEWYMAEHADEAPEAIADVVAAIKAAKEKIMELEEAKQKSHSRRDPCRWRGCRRNGWHSGDEDLPCVRKCLSR